MYSNNIKLFLCDQLSGVRFLSLLATQNINMFFDTFKTYKQILNLYELRGSFMCVSPLKKNYKYTNFLSEHWNQETNNRHVQILSSTILLYFFFFK